MFRVFSGCFLVLTVTLSGCQPKPAPAANLVSHSKLFGLYEFEIERPAGTDDDLTAHRTDDGGGHINELIDIKVGGQHLRAANGELSLNDSKRGKLRPGDKVRLTADGKLYVNGEERGG